MVRFNVFERDPTELLAEMTEPMRTDTLRLAPMAIKWMKGFKQ